MSDILDGYCRCGCGELTNIYRGKPRKFIKGHQARGENNSRFGIMMNDELKKKISEVRKGQGSPWWEGRQHTDESKKKMSESHASMFGENNPFYGKHHTEDSKNKIRLGNAIYRANYKHVIPSKPERIIHNVLKTFGIRFETEVVVGVFCVDIIIPDYKIIIFIDGCYWHACMEHFPNNKKRQSDASRVAYLKAFDYDVEILWEHDIENEATRLIEDICQKYQIPIKNMLLE